MKITFHRITAVFLAVLLCCGTALPVIADYGRPSPICALGTDPSDMLSGGGRRVQVENRQYYIDDADASVYELSQPTTPILTGPVAGLNYEDGVLYYARLREADFDLCAFDLEAGTERVLLQGFAGSVGQLYLVNGEALVFSSADTVFSYALADGSCRQLLNVPELWSFVPTGRGLIYATGNLFDYALYANERFLVRNVQDYTVRFDLGNGLLVYTCGGENYQMDLAAVFDGRIEIREYTGYSFDPEVERLEADAWEWYVPGPATGITRSTAGAISASTAASRGTVSLLPQDAQLRMQASEGTLNIVRRARQMLNVQWTPVDGIPGWGYTDLSYELLIYYSAGVTYRGLPYGQGMSYVPWNSSYSGFLNAVRNIDSKMYTERCSYARGSQYFGTDCAGFVSWAWGTTVNGSSTPQRKTCGSLMDWENTMKIGQSYSQIQLGDALICGSHAVLVTDVTYSADGAINSIEISQANPTLSYNGCCYSTRYTGTAALQRLNTNYFINSSYSIYRNKVRDSVSYTHDCNVPLEGDVCDRCGCGAAADLEPDAYVSTGIDVSVHQGDINWKIVASQIDFAILRVGITIEGETGIDSKVADNVRGCVENDIPFGLYYYTRATTREKAIAEADCILSWLRENNVTPTLPIFFDVEATGSILHESVSNAKRAEICAAFCNRLEDAGYRAGVYASASVWNGQLQGSAFDNTVRWVAHWYTDTVSATQGANLWQYSDKGRILGINTVVDLDYWVGPLGDTEHPSKISLTAASGCVEGKMISSCVKCNQLTEQYLRGTGHTPGKVVRNVEIEPTCTEIGRCEETVYCAVCGKLASHMLVPMEPLGHSWKTTEIQTVSTSLHGSSGIYTCSRCAETKDAPLCATEVFRDMPKQGHWAHDAIDWAYFNGLFSGVSDQSFGLNITMDRAMLATVLYSIAGRPDVDGELPFRDVKKKAYYYKAVLWANQVGVANGTGENRFSPTVPVTREQVTVMLLGYLNTLGQNPEIDKTILSNYPDVGSVSRYAVSGMAWAVSNGILDGSRANDAVYLLPGESATRAQVAVMFMKYTGLLQELGFWSPVIQLQELPPEDEEQPEDLPPQQGEQPEPLPDRDEEQPEALPSPEEAQSEQLPQQEEQPEALPSPEEAQPEALPLQDEIQAANH